MVGPFQCNCRILACPSTGQTLIVDPGDDADRIVRAVESIKTTSGLPLRVEALFHTHAHLDHIGATRSVKERMGPEAQIFLHGDDEFLYQKLVMQGQMFGIAYNEPLPVDRRVVHEETFAIGTLRFSVIHTPGHSPGSVSLRLHESSESGAKETVFSGDTLFFRSVGRTDLWGADQDVMFQSIRERLFTLDGDTRVCPGHGPDTAIGAEKKLNPFLN